MVIKCLSAFFKTEWKTQSYDNPSALIICNGNPPLMYFHNFFAQTQTQTVSAALLGAGLFLFSPHQHPGKDVPNFASKDGNA
jgi:hypothetical protein